jgi:hypothetical protein
VPPQRVGCFKHLDICILFGHSGDKYIIT